MFFCVVLPILPVLSQSIPIVSFRTVNLVNIVHSILPVPSVLPQSTPVGSLRIADLTNIIDQVSSFIFCMRSYLSHLFYLSSCLNFLDQFYTNFINEPLQNWFQQLLSLSTIASHPFSSSHLWAPDSPLYPPWSLSDSVVLSSMMAICLWGGMGEYMLHIIVKFRVYIHPLNW